MTFYQNIFIHLFCTLYIKHGLFVLIYDPLQLAIVLIPLQNHYKAIKRYDLKRILFMFFTLKSVRKKNVNLI